MVFFVSEWVYVVKLPLEMEKVKSIRPISCGKPEKRFFVKNVEIYLVEFIQFDSYNGKHNKIMVEPVLCAEGNGMGYLLGLCGFALFFLSDYNDWRLHWAPLKVCFPVGGGLLAASTIWEICRREPLVSGWLRGSILALAAGWFLLLIYTLFFALPVKEAYACPGEKRRVCTTGVYALCRHPGVLWFAGVYVCLWGAEGIPLGLVLLLNALNVGLVWFEDRCVFPDVLEGYDTYQRETPFLIPTGKSIRACVKKV